MTHSRRNLLTAVAALALVALAPACHHPRFTQTPGETDQKIRAVHFQSSTGAPLALNPKPLLPRLGQRAGNLVYPDRYYNPFQLAEDHLRVQTHWQSFGYFDAVVEPPVVERHDDGTLSIRWTITENTPFTIQDLSLVYAQPSEHDAALRALIPFEPGAAVDLEAYRRARIPMADHLRRNGFGHAMVYSRAFIDRDAHQVHWFYYIDQGPQTRTGQVTVEGHQRVPSQNIQARMGLDPGEPLDQSTKDKAAADLLDTGSFVSAFLSDDAQIEFLVGKPPPDSGGELAPSQVDPDGNLQPRALSPDLNVRAFVVEAPATQIDADAGGGADFTRWDTTAGSTLWLRDVWGAFGHIVAEGFVGYGDWWSGTPQGGDPSLVGVYGEGLVRLTQAGVGWRLLDLRLTTRYRSVLYPGYRLGELTAGPGLRSTFAKGVFLDLDLLYRFGHTQGLGLIDATTRDKLSLQDDDTSQGLDVLLRLISDQRNDRVEASRGWLAGLTLDYSPGAALGTHRYLGLGLDARAWIGLGGAWSLGIKGDLRWVLLADSDAGVPLGPRLFGGGAFGLRGYGRQQLSPAGVVCAQDGVCGELPLGGLSLWESSVEARWLPFRQPYGAAFFTDLGGSGAGQNPLAEGVSLAFGAGLRVRLWHIPLALDVSYLLLDRSHLTAPDTLSTYGLFLRMGEAF